MTKKISVSTKNSFAVLLRLFSRGICVSSKWRTWAFGKTVANHREKEENRKKMK